ncbi:MAG: penicillin-binding protein, partial [Clostridia bacterium]|nr:penicillin-binding protein [Clostridia bacterium]
MKQILSRSWVLILVLVLFCTGLFLLYGQLAVLGPKWVAYPTNRHIYKDGHLTKGGTITDRNGIVLCQTVNGVRSYHEDETIRKATVHTVGDLDGFVSTGVHAVFWKEVTGYDPINGVYGSGNDIELTIDANLSVTAYKALGNRAGAVGVYNYKTGEILCMASTPSFDHACQTGLAEEKGVYVNRLLSGSYAPGSVFKTVTALSALENLENPTSVTFSCKRGVTIEGEWLSCLGNHGTLGLDKALVHSCNAAFSQFALALGRKTLTKTAEQVGFNKTLTVNGIACTQSSYQVEHSNEIDFGWSGIGQHNDTVNPFQFLTFMGGIAGEGTCVWPYFIQTKGFSKEQKTLSMMNKEA